MIVEYDGWQFDDNQMQWTQNTTFNRDQRNNRRSFTRTVRLQGFIKGDSQAQIKSKIQEIEDAFDHDGGDLRLYHNDGTTISAHVLSNADSISGVMIDSGPNFDNGTGPEYATERTFNVTLSAEYSGGDSDNLVAHQEQLRIVGTGGRRIVGVEFLQEVPELQIVNQRTLVYATQSGSAIGWNSYPVFPGPLAVLAAYEQQDKRVETAGSPSFNGRVYKNYPISWSYEFIGASLPIALPGVPT